MPIPRLPPVGTGLEGLACCREGMSKAREHGVVPEPRLGKGGLTLTSLGSGGVQEEDLPCLLGLQLSSSFSG